MATQCRLALIFPSSLFRVEKQLAPDNLARAINTTLFETKMISNINNVLSDSIKKLDISEKIRDYWIKEMNITPDLFKSAIIKMANKHNTPNKSTVPNASGTPPEQQQEDGDSTSHPIRNSMDNVC